MQVCLNSRAVSSLPVEEMAAHAMALRDRALMSALLRLLTRPLFAMARALGGAGPTDDARGRACSGRVPGGSTSSGRPIRSAASRANDCNSVSEGLASQTTRV
jgi:hypothetical protein